VFSSHSTPVTSRTYLVAITVAVLLISCAAGLTSCKTIKVGAAKRIQPASKEEYGKSKLEEFHSTVDESYADRMFVVLSLYSRLMGHPPSSLKEVIQEGYLPLPPSYTFRDEKGNDLVCSRSDIQLKYEPANYTITSFYANQLRLE
jgi:hypothetical protein